MKKELGDTPSATYKRPTTMNLSGPCCSEGEGCTQPDCTGTPMATAVKHYWGEPLVTACGRPREQVPWTTNLPDVTCPDCGAPDSALRQRLTDALDRMVCPWDKRIVERLLAADTQEGRVVKAHG